MNCSSNRHLDYRAGELCCEQVPLTSLAEQFGTPAYVYSQSLILEKLRAHQHALERVPSLICYSVKANSNLNILRLLRQEGAGFDIVSGGELSRVVRVQADSSRIVFSGVGKQTSEIDAALQAGILMFNVESAAELHLIASRARHWGRRAPVSIRVNPDVEAQTHPYISTGQSIHKFGVPKEEALSLYRWAKDSQGLQVLGIACHIGSQILELGPFLKAFDEIRNLAEALRAEGLPLRYLDLGGGFGIRYANEIPLEFSQLAEELEARMRGAPYCLIVEPGRAIVGEAGLLLTRVLYVKHHSTKNFIVVDGGMNDLMRPALYGSFHEIVAVRQGSTAKLRADVVGPICETGDFLAQDREMPDVQAGDLLAVLTAGAYGYALASNYNSRPRPAELLVHARQVQLIRRRETVEELMAGESF